MHDAVIAERCTGSCVEIGRKIQRLRLVRQVALRHHDVLRVGARAVLADVAVDRVARLPAHHAGADLVDDAGEIDARHDRQRRVEEAPQVAVAELPVVGIDAGGELAHPHRARRRLDDIQRTHYPTHVPRQIDDRIRASPGRRCSQSKKSPAALWRQRARFFSSFREMMEMESGWGTGTLVCNESRSFAIAE